MAVGIYDRVREEIVKEAVKSADREIIGVGIGRRIGDTIVVTEFSMPETFDSSVAHAHMSAEQLLSTERYVDETQGEAILCLIHSHLGEPYPSSIDKKEFESWKHGIIVSAYTGEMRAYRSDGRKTLEEELVVLGRGGNKQYVDMYDRHVRVVGKDNQLRIRNSKIAIVGVGAVGCVVAIELACAGVGKISLVDHDIIEHHNIPRFIPASLNDSGNSKVIVSRNFLQDRFPHVKVGTHNDVIENMPDRFFQEHDVIVSATDGIGSRYWIQEQCLTHEKVMIDSGINKNIVRVSLFKPGSGVCLACNSISSVKKRATPLKPLNDTLRAYMPKLKSIGILTFERLRDFDRGELISVFGMDTTKKLIKSANLGCTGNVKMDEPDPSLSWSTHLAGMFASLQAINVILGYPAIDNTLMFNCQNFAMDIIKFRGTDECPIKKRLEEDNEEWKH